MFVRYKIVGPKGVCVSRTGICFSGLSTLIEDKNIYDEDGKYRLVYTMSLPERTPLDYLFIKHVLRHPLFKELYDARVTFRAREVDFSTKITSNYHRTIFYPMLARYLHEGRGVVRAWWKFFHAGIDPLQAVVLAENYTYAQRPHIAHRLCSYLADRKVLPFKDWPRFIVHQLTAPVGSRWGGVYYRGISESFTSMSHETFPALSDMSALLSAKAHIPNRHNYKEINKVAEVLSQPIFETYQTQEQAPYEDL